MKVDTGSVKAYFTSGWNILDIVSICIQLVGIGLWYAAVTHYHRKAILYLSLIYRRRPLPPQGYTDSTTVVYAVYCSGL